ncbi:hypothetical protein BYT27DRAFT_7193620 [Phlegmacium glaucopus]|nr:hypothetical protein BYT27DRAFT_7193620 [Phlegmacium glaucopus]
MGFVFWWSVRDLDAKEDELDNLVESDLSKVSEFMLILPAGWGLWPSQYKGVKVSMIVYSVRCHSRGSVGAYQYVTGDQISFTVVKYCISL